MIQMNASKIYSIVLILIILQYNHAKPKAEAESDDSVVPEDIEDGSILDEEEPPTKGGAKNISPSAIDEYMKEHPEVKQMPSPSADGKAVKMKRVYNKFGDVVSIPDNSPVPHKAEKTAQNPQMLKQLPPNPYPYPYFNAYAMNPYLNSQLGGQSQAQLLPPMQGMLQQPLPPMQGIPQQPPQQPGSPVTPQELAQYHLQPRTGPEDQSKSETEFNEKMFQMMQNQRMALQMQRMGSNGTAIRTLPPFPPIQSQQQMIQSMMPPMMPAFPQPYPPFQPFYNPNQYKIDRNNIKISALPFPNGVGMDPNLLKQLESGRAQLDVANARVIPVEPVPSTEEPLPTESESLDDQPELPEVVLPKTTIKPKHKRKGNRMPKRHFRHRARHEARKPHFLMRARLNKLPKKGQKGGDEWWTKPVPELCNEPIIEITNCKERHLEKRWSFNKEDEKCYLYEDLCYKLKKNTFKSLKDCMIACWRPK